MTVIVLLLRDPFSPRREPIDWPGVALLALGLGCMQFLLDNGERRDWFADPQIAMAGLVSLCALAAFVWWQWSGTRRPVVDLHVLRYRSVSVGSLIGLAFGALIFAPAILTPLYASLILGYTAWDSGLLLALRALPVVFLTPVFATLAERGADVRYFLGLGFALTAASLAWMATQMTSNTPFGPLAFALFVSGIAQSMLLVPLIVGVLSTTPPELNGKVSPIITLSVQLGGSIASAASIAFFDRRASLHSAMLGQSVTLAHLQSSAVHGSLQQLASLVVQQSNTMAFSDAIFAAGMLAALIAPLVLAFPRSKGMANDSGSSLAH